MATMQTACRVCDGDLSLRIAGTNGHAPVAEAFSPSRHELGRHGDLLAAASAATVQQPMLPQRRRSCTTSTARCATTSTWPRRPGRRATANRLLDLIGAHVPAGRLLDVGCGHGLLLDEARKRGYETVGLELSREAARYARETLGLDVRELPLEAFSEGRNGDSPGELRRGRARRRARAPRRPGRRDRPLRGAAAARRACCASSRPTRPRLTARLAGARWWGYLPAHTVPAAARARCAS